MEVCKLWSLSNKNAFRYWIQSLTLAFLSAASNKVFISKSLSSKHAANILVDSWSCSSAACASFLLSRALAWITQ